MTSLFEEEGIDVIIFKRQDTAGPGVFDRDAPWGVARVAESDFDRAKSLWEDWLEAGPPEIGLEDGSQRQRSPIQGATWRDRMDVVSHRRRRGMCRHVLLSGGLADPSALLLHDEGSFPLPS